MECHDLAAEDGGLQQRGIVKLLAEAPAFVGWRDGKLAERASREAEEILSGRPGNR